MSDLKKPFLVIDFAKSDRGSIFVGCGSADIIDEQGALVTLSKCPDGMSVGECVPGLPSYEDIIAAFLFHTEKSVDVVIEMLEHAKKRLKKEESQCQAEQIMKIENKQE